MAAHMGYGAAKAFPAGVSVFKGEGGKWFRFADTSFSPGDDFCSVWHFIDMIPEGKAGWHPKLSYTQDG